MAITLPNVESRSLDERYEIISLFIKQEATRLNQRIDVERDAILAFMLYEAEGNIGQIKRDLKLVCAKAFLHYRTYGKKHLLIRKEDCSLQVQKGLLKIKEMSERLDRFLEGKGDFLSFEPGDQDVVWSQDPQRNMQVYNEIEEKVSSLIETGARPRPARCWKIPIWARATSPRKRWILQVISASIPTISTPSKNYLLKRKDLPCLK